MNETEKTTEYVMKSVLIKKKMRISFLFLLLVSLCCILLFVSCNKQENTKTSNVARQAEEVEQTKKWHESETCVALVLGLGYTEDTFVNNLLSILEDEFGLESDKGLIYPLRFPEDFVYNGVKGRISSLPDMLLEKNVEALFVVGAPDGTHRALANIQDRRVKEKGLDVPIFSLFPQDDVLGIESGSDMVIDFAQFYSSSGGMSEEGGLEHLSLVPNILLSLIKKEKQFDRNFSVEEKKQFLKKSLGFAWKVDTIADVQTGLRSKNHFEISLIGEYSDTASVVDSVIVVDKNVNKK